MTGSWNSDLSVEHNKVNINVVTITESSVKERRTLGKKCRVPILAPGDYGKLASPCPESDIREIRLSFKSK